MKVLGAFFLFVRATTALVGEVTTTTPQSETTLAPTPHDLSNATDGVVFSGIELALNGTEGTLELNATARGHGEGLEAAAAGLNNNTIDDSLSTPPPLPPSTAAPAPAASSALPTSSDPEEPTSATPTPPDDTPPPPLPDFLASDVPSAPEFLSFNEWREKFAVLPDASARRSKKAAQRSRQDATNTNGGDATFDGDGLDFGSLFASEDGGVNKLGYEEGGVQGHVELVQLRREGSTRDELAANDSQPPVAEARQTDLSIGTIASPIQPLAHTGSGDSLDPLVPLKDRSNYALFECAAMVHRSSPQSKGASSILVEKKDRYMLTPCSAEPKFVELELCDEIKIDTIVLANFEFFSSMFKHFSIKVSVNYPGRADEWHDLGTFRARNMRGIQAFHPKSILGFYRYMRIDFVSHYGSEFYCPVSLLRVYGITQMDAYRREAEDEKEKQAAAALSAAEADEEDALDIVDVPVVQELVVEKPTTVQLANTTMEEPVESTMATITSMSNTITATSSSEGSSSPSAEGAVDSPDSEPSPASTATSTTPSTATSAFVPPSTPIATITPSRTLDVTSIGSTLVTTAISATTVHTSVPNPKERVGSNPVAPSQNLTAPFTVVESPTSGTETPVSVSSELDTRSSKEVVEAPSQVVQSTLFVPESTPAPTPTTQTSSSIEILTTAVFITATNGTTMDAFPSALNTTTTGTASPLTSDAAIPSNSTTTSSRSPPIESSTSSRASPSSEPTESRRAPPPMPPPVQPTPGESIYGTIMKRLTSLEHNQTLSMHYIEAQSAMLREAFGRVEKRLAIFEGGRDMQEALVREAIVEMDKHRLSLDRDRVALALQLNILTQEVLFEKRLGVVLLMGLLALFVFVGVTRGSSPTPFLVFVPAPDRRYVRKESNTSEELVGGEDRVEELVDGHRKPRVRGASTMPRTPSLKHHSTPSRRLYGPLTSSKPPRPIRTWTPPQRADSLPSEGSTSALLVGQPQTEVRRRKGAGAEMSRVSATERVRRHSTFEVSSPRMLGEDPSKEGERPQGGSRDSMEERGYKTLSGSEDEGIIQPLVLERSSRPKAVVGVRPRSSSGRMGGDAETPPRFVPRSTLPSPPPEPVKVTTVEEGKGEDREKNLGTGGTSL